MTQLGVFLALVAATAACIGAFVTIVENGWERRAALVGAICFFLAVLWGISWLVVN